MSYQRKSWQEKLNDDKGVPRVVEITERMSKRWGTGTCVVPAPKEVDAIMKRVPGGKLTTINEIRNALQRSIMQRSVAPSQQESLLRLRLMQQPTRRRKEIKI